MIYLRAAILTIFILIVMLLVYMFISFDTNYELNLAMEEFQRGNIDKARAELQRLTRAVPKDQLLLYEAYIDRAMQQNEKAEKSLDEAAVLAKNENQKSLLLEIYLNKVYNAYLANEPDEFQANLMLAQQLAPKDPWVRFFSNIGKFCTEKYKDAQDFWNKEYPKTALSGWMKKSFEETFNTTWLAMQLARCQIEAKNFMTARQILEEEMQRASPSYLSEINFLLGLSYLKEAAGKPADAAGPYYKLAFSYFDQVPMMQPRFAVEKEQVSEDVFQAIESAVNSHSYENLPFLFGALEKWQASKQLAIATKQLVSLMNDEIKAKHWKNAQGMMMLLARILPEGETRQAVSRQFKELAQQALVQGDFEHLHELWEASRQFSADPEELNQQFEKVTENRITTLIPVEDPSLIRTAEYVAFWESIEKDNKKRVSLADHLIAMSVDLWLAEGEEQRALNLMKIASEIPYQADREEIKNLMGIVIKRIYRYAAEQDKVEKLPYLLEAVQALNLTNVNLNDKKAVANYQADAKYLYAHKRYLDAERIAEWLLRLNPRDQDARKILGLSSYYLGNYPRALTNLSELPELDKEAMESLAISRAIVEHTPATFQMLEQMEGKHMISSGSYLRLGLGLIEAGLPSEAMIWLEKMPHPGNEDFAALAYAKYLMGEWEGVIKTYDKLTPPYHNIPAMEGIRILSLGHLGNTETAEKELQDLLSDPKHVEVDEFSSEFALFYNKVLERLNPNEIALRFYRDIKKDPETAKKYLNKIRSDESDNEYMEPSLPHAH